jgi:PTS system cellobiose-specific IIC component
VSKKYFKGGKNMDKMADTLGRVGAWCAQNKYLSSIKNAFQTYMPMTIAGAIGVLWCNVLVSANDGALGSIFEPIMALDFLNPAFAAVQFATISCITVGITFGIAQEIGVWNLTADKAGYFPGLLGLASWLSVTQNSYAIEGSETAFSGLSGSALGATGLFTGMVIAVLSVEIFCWLSKKEALKIKMPETVPPGVARAFEVLVPAFITLTLISFIGLIANQFNNANGQMLYLNDIIIQFMDPIVNVGASLPGVFVIYILIMLFWLVGIHGNNMLAAVKETLFTPLGIANMEAFNEGKDPENIFTMQWLQMFGEFGGSGCTIGLVIAIFIFSKRADNRAVATLSIVPGLFNINETVTFGIPMVLNPILGIPFIFTPFICIVIGYILTIIGFCPKTIAIAPWTTPPLLFGFIATGSIMGAVSQGIAIVASILCFAPFLIAYERQQNKEAAAAAE